MKRLVALLCLVFAIVGCSSVAPPNPKTEYLLKADPSAITSTQLLEHAVKCEDHFVKFHKSEGMLWQGFYTDPKLDEPDCYGSGGDTLLFTGFYLAASSFRYSVTKNPADLDKVVDTVRGLYALTHVLGVPGNMARCALPLSNAKKFLYPEAWGGRIGTPDDIGFVYTGVTTLPDPFDNTKNYPQFVYYTRVSRDQLSGLSFGLGTFWSVLDPAKDQALAGNAKLAKAREVVGDIVNDVWTRLANNDFLIRDHTNRNDTADDVDGLLRLQLHSVYRRMVAERYPDWALKVNADYDEAFDSYFGFFGDPSNWFNVFSNLSQYYAWNLRFSRAYVVHLLDENPEHQKTVAEFTRSSLFSHVDDHQNPHFTFIYDSMRKDDPVRLDDALFSLKAQSIRPFRSYDSPIALEGSPPQGFWKWPYRIVTGIPHMLGFTKAVPAHLRESTTYFQWQDDPWDTGYVGNTGQEENAGLDFLLPYWMGRYYGFIK